MSSTKIVEFDKEKFPKLYHLKIAFEENLFRLTVTVRFQKHESFKNVNFFILFFSQ